MNFQEAALGADLAVWRLVKEKYITEAFSGRGAKLYPGRWHNKGAGVVYTAGSVSLAILEMLVQAAVIPVYWSVRATLPRGLPVTRLELASLPDDWRDSPAPGLIRAIGSEWYAAGQSCALAVPSSLVPSEFNYILNPEHPDFSRMIIGAGEKIPLDGRLMKGAK